MLKIICLCFFCGHSVEVLAWVLGIWAPTKHQVCYNVVK